MKILNWITLALNIQCIILSILNKNIMSICGWSSSLIYFIIIIAEEYKKNKENK